jgi:hypothetical protein
LKRPAAFVRYGIAVDANHSQRYKSLYVNASRGWSRRKAAFLQATGELGKRVTEYLEKIEPVLLPEIGFGSSATRSRSPAAQTTDCIAPGITFLALGQLGTMLRYADQQEVDVLVMFQVEERAQKVSLQVHDVLGGRPLYKSKPISYRTRERELRDPLYKDPIEITMREFADLVEQKLVASEIPSTINAALVSKRAEWLTRKGPTTPLRILAELHFYRQIGLLSVDQILASYQSILGEENGLKLLAGKRSDREEALASFVPQFELADIFSSQRSGRDD